MKYNRILAINPWIHDFAAHDFWLKPYGFLTLLSYLKNKGIEVDYIDCLQKMTSRDIYGRGKYASEIISKPKILSKVRRKFKRYGKSPSEVENELPEGPFDYILITSSMTYWYPGIFEVVKIITEKSPKTPIILGGTYSNLCPEHAQINFPEVSVFTNNHLKSFFQLLDIEYNPKELFSTLPDYKSFYSQHPYIVLRTSWGCPFNCKYCAIQKNFPKFLNLPQEKIINFILEYYNLGVRNFVFYDDALLYNKDYLKEFLTKIKKLNLSLKFHTPNALHMRYLDNEIAGLLKTTGFINPHFGVETLDLNLQKELGGKVTTEEVIKGIKILKQEGFKNGEFSVYLFLGYPNQNLNSLKEEIDFLHSQGAKISLAEFSLTPGTDIFQKYKEDYSEPLLHNNSIFSFYPQHKIGQLQYLKIYTRQLNKKF